MRAGRLAVVSVTVLIALVLQASLLPPFSWRGIVPDLCLLVVVAAGLAKDARFAMLVGFGTGLLLDLAPPADHAAGRWALAFVLVGFVAGSARQDQPPARSSLAAIIGVCSVVGGSVFALTGLLLGESALGVTGSLGVVLVAAVLDVVVGLLVVPPLMRLFDRADPVPVAA